MDKQLCEKCGERPVTSYRGTNEDLRAYIAKHGGYTVCSVCAMESIERMLVRVEEEGLRVFAAMTEEEKISYMCSKFSLTPEYIHEEGKKIRARVEKLLAKHGSPNDG